MQGTSQQVASRYLSRKASLYVWQCEIDLPTEIVESCRKVIEGWHLRRPPDVIVLTVAVKVRGRQLFAVGVCVWHCRAETGEDNGARVPELKASLLHVSPR